MNEMRVISERLEIRPNSIEQMKLKYEAEQNQEMKQAYLEMIEGMKQLPGREEWACDWGIYLKDGTYIGGIGFKGIPDQEGKVEIGYGIEEDFRNRGYAGEALGAMVTWALGKEEVRCIQAQIEAWNEASRKVLKHNGFIEAGVGEEGPLFEVRKNKSEG